MAVVSPSQLDERRKRIERKKIKQSGEVLTFSGYSGDGFLRVRLCFSVFEEFSYCRELKSEENIVSNLTALASDTRRSRAKSLPWRRTTIV